MKHPKPKTRPTSRRGIKLPTVLTEEERRALLQQPNERTATGLRNACLLTVMLDAGLRAAEVLHVHVHDVDCEKRCQEVFLISQYT